VKLALLAAAGVAASLLAGCGSGSGREPAAAPSTVETVVRTVAANELTQQGRLPACVDFHSPPFAFSEDGRKTGFEVELLERIARRLGLGVVWVPTPRTEFAAALNARKCDVIVSRLGYDLDTQFRLDVGALQYMALPLALVLPNGSSTEPVDFGDLCGRRLAVVAWTAPAFLAREQQRTCLDEDRPALRVTEAPTDAAALELVANGRADGLLDDSFSASAALAADDRFAIADVTGRKGYTSLGYRKPGLSIEAGVHAALLTLYDDGVVRRLVKRWHLEDATLLPLP
jgi:polar amino acid transport system substrate-binding protein